MELRENKMGVMPVNKLILNMSLPMMASMLVQALYNIVDSIFVAQISEEALTAVSLSFPVQTLMIAVAGGTSVGVNALLSRALGERNTKRVNQIATNGAFLAVMGFLLFLIFGIFGSHMFFAGQTQATESGRKIMQYGEQYLSICCICSLGIFVQCMFESNYSVPR